MCDQLLDEVFRLGRGELFVEIDDEQMPDAERANQRDFVLGGGEQMRRLIAAAKLFPDADRR